MLFVLKKNMAVIHNKGNGKLFPLYLERNIDLLKENNLLTKLSGDDEEDIIKNWLSSEPVFESYDKFLEFCEEK